MNEGNIHKSMKKLWDNPKMTASIPNRAKLSIEAKTEDLVNICKILRD